MEECINANILKDFLLEHKAEVVAMSIYEYNEEYVRKSLFEDGVKTGYKEGYTTLPCIVVITFSGTPSASG